MTQPSSRSRLATAFLLLIMGSAMVLGAVVSWMITSGLAPSAAEAVSDPEVRARSRPEHEALRTAPAPSDLDRVPAEPMVVEPPLVFAECVERLCRLTLRTAELAEQDEIDAAREVDEQTRSLVARVLDAFADVGERSLALVADIDDAAMDEPRPPLVATRMAVLEFLLGAELARRHELAIRVDDPTRVDALVHALLEAMPTTSAFASIGDRCLHRRPYLRLRHEPGVLELVRLAGQDLFQRKIASNLLMTLWDNVKLHGERSSTELTQLALLFLDDGDPSRLQAACRHLLADPDYRSFVVSWLRERNDPALTGGIARYAAGELPVDDALAVLRALAPMLEHTRGTYVGLGARAPARLEDAYREHLAANNHPVIRRELVMGVGVQPDARGVEIARLALDNDPSPDVRLQAMFVFTMQDDMQAAERAVAQVLDDPAIANDPLRLESVVLALQNLEHGDVNAVARLGSRLQSMALSEQGRKLLDQLLARSLPTHQGTKKNG